jgi:enediyne biosynthesis protein E4
MISCSEKNASDGEIKNNPLLVLLDSSLTQIMFNNRLQEDEMRNVLMYEYFYNGAGVAIGDINNDGLDDIYFNANMSSNKLYLNEGGMRFRDISAQSHAGGRQFWKTGVTMVDINADGWLDIYVCYSGNTSPERRRNQLFINNQDLTFTEQAYKFGLDIPAFSNQSTFFDYDLDGDLDMFLLNHNPVRYNSLEETAVKELMNSNDTLMGVGLYRNDQMKFVNTTVKAGISASKLTYGLGASIADFNGDNKPDIYISNDYWSPNYLYINNGDGTFTDHIRSAFGHFSQFSMGCDAADYNNDGLIDIMTLDMLPEDNARQKLLFAPENYDVFEHNVRIGFQHQYMRNMLHLNNGDGSFSEIGQLAGVSNTDWSWSSLFVDLDNDGWKDMVVTNGYLRDYTNLDFLKYMNTFMQDLRGRPTPSELIGLLKKMPASKVENYVFKNNGDLTFANMNSEWGFARPSTSNGAAYGDLDNDGDMDIVINNINATAFIYQNQASQITNNNFVQVQLKAKGLNVFGTGATVKLFSSGKSQITELQPSRGYLSSVTHIAHFGLGNAKADGQTDQLQGNGILK